MTQNRKNLDTSPRMEENRKTLEKMISRRGKIDHDETLQADKQFDELIIMYYREEMIKK